MDIKLEKGKAVSRTVTAITSKSYVHRLLLAAALYEKNISIRSNICSKDMEATIRVINALGGLVSVREIEPEDDESGGYLFTIERTLPEGASHAGKHGSTEPVVLDCGESGSTARFILPIASLFADTVTVTGSGKLPARPMGPLCDVLRAAGVAVSSDYLPITLSGKPCAGNYRIAGNISSQFITGLLFMMPLIDGASSLEIEGALESAPYVDMTVDVLGKFGVDYKTENQGKTEDSKSGTIVYYVNHNATKKQVGYSNNPDGIQTGAAEDATVIIAEGDWSNAAYIMAIASLGCGSAFSEVTIEGLNSESIQGDREIIRLLEKFGVSIRRVGEEGKSGDGKRYGYKVCGNPYRSIDADCSQIPDLVPALAVIAAYNDGDSIFRNVERLRIKECDRIDAVTDMLLQIGVKVDITQNDGHESMIVHGKGMDSPVPETITIDSRNDHRIAMAAAAIAFAESVPVVIKDAMAVNKSYPGFYEVIAKLGMNSQEA